MNWHSRLKSVMNEDLPGTGSHLKMLPPGRSLIPESDIDFRVRKSSVLLLLFEENDEIYVCLIKRPVHMKHHPGQIGLPGGMIELTDYTLTDTALRETNEELGIDKKSVEIIGNLSELYISVSRFLIYPLIGWSHRKPQFTLNPFEVEKIIFFPILNHLHNCRSEFAFVETSLGRLLVPCIKYDGEIIWGATAMILTEFLDLLKIHVLGPEKI